MNKTKIFNTISLIINISIVILVIVAITMMFFGDYGELVSSGWGAFKYFTVDSNALVGVISIFYIVYLIKRMNGKSNKASHFITIMKLMGTVSVALTFFTVIFFLGFVYGFMNMYKGTNLFLHLIIPLLTMIDFLIFNRHGLYRFKDTFFAIIPMFIYGISYLINLIVHNGYGDIKYDWYAFGAYGLGIGIAIFLLLIVLTYGLSVAFFFLRKVISKK